MAAKIETSPEMVKKVYETTRAKTQVIRKRLGRDLTLAEKIIYGHLDDPQNRKSNAVKAFFF